MKNPTKIKVPKKYADFIDEIHDGDGYWAYCKDGYIFGATGCQTAHAYTQKEILAEIRTLQENN
ncbi:hypothetical protein ACWN8V_07135 [Vagococcus elongatus]|uniref:Uncharacterized protein n=1 Tax=Vagococcus elongatus TaxID=180344 RepID=A0A430AW78_9ENTE|nr:hypothetical protein [Vagococcus elongatus]RSU12305.1 hypothetical protein CBF29_06805 [Vagococcus elongatus]